MGWAEKEFGNLQLGDKRLSSRAVVLAEQLGQNPTASIPQACGGWGEIRAAYRFLAQDEIEWNALMTSHWECTHQRMGQHQVVLCIQDTTELNFNGQDIEDLGPLCHEAQRGMYMHPTYAVSVSREPLGIVDLWMWSREFKEKDGKRPGPRESRRWPEGYAHLAQWATTLPQTRLVYMADREGDMMELMRTARDLGTPVDWLLRSSHNRTLPEGGALWEAVKESAPLGSIEFMLPSRGGRKARRVRQAIFARRVELPDGEGGTVSATCLIAKETDPPEGVEALEWRLLTNRDVTTLKAAEELIEWYLARWEIELFFHILKNGCKVEALQLSSMERVEKALALYAVIAWRINRLMRLGRLCPDLKADLLLEKEEWQAAYILNKKKPPKETPALNEVLRMIAKLGGFIGRKRDGEPGAKTLWLGLQRVMDFAEGVHFTRENGIS